MPNSLSTAGFRPRSAIAFATSALMLGVVALTGVHPVAAVDLATSTTDLQASALSVQQHHVLTLTATVVAGPIPIPSTSPDPSAPPLPSPGPNPVPTGSATFEDHFGSVVTPHVVTLDANGVASLDLPTLSAGSHVFRASYSGDAVVAPSTSADVTVTVTVDTVDASGVRLTSSAIYPIVDGYRDTLKAVGLRAEPISVAIVVKNSSSKIVRKGSIGRATGAYAWTWNGRNSSNKIVPAGRYTITVSLRDAAGTTRTVKSYVTVSLKRLVWKSFAQTKTWAQRSWNGFSGAAAGWAFKVPSATVYGKVTVKLYAAGLDTAFAVRLKTCGGSAWNLSCFDGARAIGPSLRWYSTSVAGATHVSSTHLVRVVAVTFNRAQVKKVSVSLRYAVLH